MSVKNTTGAGSPKQKQEMLEILHGSGAVVRGKTK